MGPALINEISSRIKNLLIAIDQLLWVVLTLGRGNPDETISAASYRLEQQEKIVGKILRPTIDFLFKIIEDQHCYKSFLSEVNRSQINKFYTEQLNHNKEQG